MPPRPLGSYSASSCPPSSSPRHGAPATTTPTGIWCAACRRCPWAPTTSWPVINCGCASGWPDICSGSTRSATTVPKPSLTTPRGCWVTGPTTGGTAMRHSNVSCWPTPPRASTMRRWSGCFTGATFGATRSWAHSGPGWSGTTRHSGSTPSPSGDDAAHSGGGDDVASVAVEFIDRAARVVAGNLDHERRDADGAQFAQVVAVAFEAGLKGPRPGVRCLDRNVDPGRVAALGDEEVAQLLDRHREFARCVQHRGAVGLGGCRLVHQRRPALPDTRHPVACAHAVAAEPHRHGLLNRPGPCGLGDRREVLARVVERVVRPDAGHRRDRLVEQLVAFGE